MAVQLQLKDIHRQPHRRLNILTGDWVLVSPHRTERPWQGQEEPLPAPPGPVYDPDCYLCPGNVRAGGHENPHYTGTFVFDNDFSAVRPEDPSAGVNRDDLLIAEGETGICRVVCFAPRHDLTLATMELGQIMQVVQTWREEYVSLGDREQINHVQIFENRGQMMGCSNAHPHGQIWAQRTIPDEPGKELREMSAYHRKHDSCMLCDYVTLELQQQERMVIENEGFVAVVPYWAVWPFETLILSRRHRGHLGELSSEELSSFAKILMQLTGRYDQLFQIPFPYSSGLHQSPTDGAPHAETHFHMHFYPPLLRSATVRKFVVGYELLAEPQRDLTPEAAARRLRELTDTRNERK